MARSNKTIRRKVIVTQMELLTRSLNILLKVAPYREGPKGLDETIAEVDSMLATLSKELNSYWLEELKYEDMSCLVDSVLSEDNHNGLSNVKPTSTSQDRQVKHKDRGQLWN